VIGRREGGPIQTPEQGPDFSRRTLDELLLLEAMDQKAHGIANWDESLCREEEFRRLCYPGIKQPESWT